MDFNLTEFIKVQLAHELKYLLVGATTWSAYSREDVGPDGRPDLATLAMEAAYVHVRNLNEFLRREDRWQPRCERSPHGGVTPYLWTAHEMAIEAKLLHPDPDRPHEPARKSDDNLMGMIVEFANEVVDNWVIVAKQLRMEAYRDD